jgi:hypothetical protein
MKYRRINIFGGPSLGKTSTAWFLSHQLKKRHYNIELCRERAKLLAYKNQVPTGLTQNTLFVEQMEEERTFLDNGVDLVVTDSPVLLAVSYGMKYGQTKEFEKYFGSVYKQYDKEYPSINILLRRSSDVYVECGRFETKEEAIRMDLKIMEHYTFYSCGGIQDLCVVDSFSDEACLAYVLSKLELEK